MSKDLWFAEFERLLNEGHTEDDAANMAHPAMCERLADLADAAKDRAKDDACWPPRPRRAKDLMTPADWEAAEDAPTGPGEP